MAKVQKSTRKFQKKHLKGVIKRRRKRQGIVRDKEARQAAVEDAAAAAAAEAAPNEKQLQEMDIDTFLDGGFEGVAPAAEMEGSEEGSEDDLEEGGLQDEDEEELLTRDEDDEGAEAAAREGGEGEESSEEEDGEVAAQNASLRRNIRSHKQQLQQLKERDPEFYEYLLQTDARLLAFGDDSGDEEEEEDDEEEEEEEVDGRDGLPSAVDEVDDGEDAGRAGVDEAAALKPAGPSGRSDVTSQLVEAWSAGALKGSLASLSRLCQAYRAACHYGEGEEEGAVSLRIASSATFNRVMIFMLKQADLVFRRVLALEKKRDVKPGDLQKAPRWKKVQPLLKSFLGNSLHLLGVVADASMLSFCLRRLRASAVFLASFERLAKLFRRKILDILGSADPGPRLQALLFLRQLALLVPGQMDACLVGVYKTYVANARFVNAASMPHISFLGACVVEMYGLDPSAGYVAAFSFIRQLAVLMRDALTSKTKDAYKQVYCWQAVNGLEVWARVVGGLYDRMEMRPLVHPVAQLLLACARLVPTPRYFPLRLRMARALNKLAAETGQFVPVAPILLEMLQWSDLSKAPTSGRGKLPDLALQLRVGKAVLRSTSFQEELISQVVELLAAHLGLWASSIAFPELAHLPTLGLKRSLKTIPVDRFRKQLRALVDAIERNTAFIGRLRSNVDFSPKDAAEVKAFMEDTQAKGGVPMKRFAEQVAEQAEERRRMRRLEDVELGQGGGDTDASDSEDAEEPADEEREQEDEPSGRSGGGRIPKGGATKLKRVRDVAAPPEDKEEQNGGGEDIIAGEYQLSDDEELDPPPRSPQQFGGPHRAATASGESSREAKRSPQTRRVQQSGNADHRAGGKGPWPKKHKKKQPPSRSAGA